MSFHCCTGSDVADVVVQTAVSPHPSGSTVPQVTLQGRTVRAEPGWYQTKGNHTTDMSRRNGLQPNEASYRLSVSVTPMLAVKARQEKCTTVYCAPSLDIHGHFNTPSMTSKGIANKCICAHSSLPSKSCNLIHNNTKISSVSSKIVFYIYLYSHPFKRIKKCKLVKCNSNLPFKQ